MVLLLIVGLIFICLVISVCLIIPSLILKKWNTRPFIAFIIALILGCSSFVFLIVSTNGFGGIIFYTKFSGLVLISFIVFLPIVSVMQISQLRKRKHLSKIDFKDIF